MVGLITNRKIDLIASTVRPLEEAADLNWALEAREVTGRAFLRVDSRP